MSDDEKKDEAAAGVPKKKPVVLFAIIGVVLIGAIAAGVIFAGPALGLGGDAAAAETKGAKGAKGAKKKKAKKVDDAGAEGETTEVIPEEDEATAGLKSKITMFKGLVVDVRDAEGTAHHIKISIAVEHAEGKEEEFATVEPRARESLISYLRNLSFEEATEPKNFDKIRAEVVRRSRQAFGEEFHARRVLISDYVAQ